MIELDNVVKRFGDRTVLDGISGRFEPGSSSLIIGGSGTGKSVLLKCIIGLLRPDEGYIRFDGQDFWNSDQEVQRAIRREMGVLFQGSALFDSQTVRQNVRFPLDMLTEMPAAEKEERVGFCLERVGLTEAADRMPSEISGGMKKRVGIARAIVMTPKYLFCDEPNSGLDPLTSVKIDELIQEITDEYKTTTVVITHDMNSVLGMGDYIMYLYQGHKLWQGDSNNILQTDVPELKEFLYSNQLLKRQKK